MPRAAAVADDDDANVQRDASVDVMLARAADNRPRCEQQWDAYRRVACSSTKPYQPRRGESSRGSRDIAGHRATLTEVVLDGELAMWAGWHADVLAKQQYTAAICRRWWRSNPVPALTTSPSGRFG
jgi:hypothetical protein